MTVALDPVSVRRALPGRQRGGLRLISWLVIVAVPTVLLGLYLQFIALPQYSVQFHYSVFTEDSSFSSSPTLTLGTGTPTRHYDFVITDYMQSEQVIADLSQRFRLPQMFNPPGWDFIFRFWWGDGSPQRLLRYWRNWIAEAHFDTYSGLGAVSVRAFNPQEALQLALGVQELCEKLINELGKPAREAHVEAAREQLRRSDTRLHEAQRQISEFRKAQRTLAPLRPAEAIESLASNLRRDISAMRTQLAALGRNLSPTAPAIVNLKSQIESSERELARVLGGFAGVAEGEAPSVGLLPDQIGVFESLQSELTYAASARETSMRLLDDALFNTRVQHLYLRLHARPQLQREPAGPRTITWTFITFIGLNLAWLSSMLMVFAMRDHTR